MKCIIEKTSEPGCEPPVKGAVIDRLLAEKNKG